MIAAPIDAVLGTGPLAARAASERDLDTPLDYIATATLPVARTVSACYPTALPPHSYRS